MIRRPPRSPLFPSPTLFRSRNALWRRRWRRFLTVSTASDPPRRTPRSGLTPRSEEHTSELQSRSDLVCRLLLEKKNHHIIVAYIIRIDSTAALIVRIHELSR